MAEHKQVERWRVDALREHPDQHELVGDVSDFEIDELARSIERDGLRQPLEILPTGVVIVGHQRLRAVRHLGHEHVDVVVRHDLAAASEAEVQRYLIEDNYFRRQMGPLEIGRACRALKRLERSGKLHLSKAARTAIRDRIAAHLGGKVSGRTLDRYEQLLDLPREIQNAVSRGELSMGAAAMVLKLTPAKQRQIVEEMLAGVPLKRAIGLYASIPEKVTKDPNDVYFKTLKHLRQSMDILESNVAALVGKAPNPDEAIVLLDRAANFFDDLYEREVATNSK